MAAVQGEVLVRCAFAGTPCCFLGLDAGLAWTSGPRICLAWVRPKWVQVFGEKEAWPTLVGFASRCSRTCRRTGCRPLLDGLGSIGILERHGPGFLFVASKGVVKRLQLVHRTYHSKDGAEILDGCHTADTFEGVQ